MTANMYFLSSILLFVLTAFETSAKSVSISNVTTYINSELSLNNGLKMPILGFGTGGNGVTPSVVYDMVINAIDAGYRHIDTAFVFHNEIEVGRAINDRIRQGVIKREDIFVVTKIWNTYHSRARAAEAIRQSLSNLNLDYIDLLLMNWPMGYKEGPVDEPLDKYKLIIPSPVDYVDTWKEMELSVGDGIVKSIGLSNFNSQQILRILDSAIIKPVINQIESHPQLSQDKLINYCKSKDIHVTAYSPLGEGRLLDRTELIAIANNHGKSTAQVMIRYQIQRGVSVIPRTVMKSHMTENFNVFDFTLTSAEMKAIDKMDTNTRYYEEKVAEKHEYYPFSTPY